MKKPHSKKWFRYATLTAVTTFLAIPLLVAGNHLTSDFGRSVDFKPLVRHMISQLHCYDTGTHDCENTNHGGNTFTKEHTLGFLLDGSRRQLTSRGFEPLYICTSRHQPTTMVTAGTVDHDPRDACRDAGFRPRRAGYISPTTGLEAPWPVYRCIHPDTDDNLLTDSPTECSSQGYQNLELLGYLYAGGPLPLQ